MDGRGHINTAHHERLPKKTKVTDVVLATKGLLERRSSSFIKVSGRMRSDTLKRIVSCGQTLSRRVLLIRDDKRVLIISNR